jgi:glycosyltransferase involved in cell wall biosynthesis
MKPVIDISIVIPVYNEEESIMPLYNKIKEVCDKINQNYEIIFIDDGSTDGTPNILKEVYSNDTKVKAIKFRRNFGQTAAMSAGFHLAEGKVIISMDGDLQNDPVDISRLLDKIEEGYDVVCGWRKERKDKLISRRVPSVVANWLISLLTGVKIHDNGCSLKAYRSHVVKEVHLYSEMHRFIPAMASIIGARVTEIVVNHHPRKFGYAKYGISRVWKVFLDLFVVKMLVSFSSRPALWFGILSLPFMFFGLLFLVLSAASYLASSSSEVISIVYPSISFLLFFLFFQLNVLGVFSELVLMTGQPLQIVTALEITVENS